jgi:hypothetical protein
MSRSNSATRVVAAIAAASAACAVVWAFRRRRLTVQLEHKVSSSPSEPFVFSSSTVARSENLSRDAQLSKCNVRIQELEAQVRDLQARLTLDMARPSPLSSGTLAPHSDFQCVIASALRRKDEAFMREVFDRHADSKSELSSAQLMAALLEVDAPVLSCDDSSADSLFRRADANLSGSVDFSECAPALFRCTRRNCLLMCSRAGSCVLLRCRTNLRCF